MECVLSVKRVALNNVRAAGRLEVRDSLSLSGRLYPPPRRSEMFSRARDHPRAFRCSIRGGRPANSLAFSLSLALAGGEVEVPPASPIIRCCSPHGSSFAE